MYVPPPLPGSPPSLALTSMDPLEDAATPNQLASGAEEGDVQVSPLSELTKILPGEVPNFGCVNQLYGAGYIRDAGPGSVPTTAPVELTPCEPSEW